MKYEDIKKAIKNNKSVYWSNDNYKIIYDEYLEEFLIHSISNNNYIKLLDDKYYLKDCYIKESN